MSAAQHLFRPKSVAIVGASETGGSGWTGAIFENLETHGFPIPVYLINPRRDELWGRQVYPDFASLPEPVDLALSIVPAKAQPDILEDGAKNGLKCALIYAARFGEGDDAEGRARAERLNGLRREYGLRVCGPNCMGALSLPERLLFYPAARVRALPAGSAGVIFQSGGTFQYWLQQAAIRGLGFSYAVSSGNELDLDIADYIDFMVEDEGTRLIFCMIEGIGRPDAFMAAAGRALEAGKPILAVKIGSSELGRQSTLSHTGALAGDDDIFNAMCRQLGVIRCPTLDGLIETGLAFNAGRIPAGRRAAMSGYSGGAKGLFLDYAHQQDLPLAQLSPETSAAIAPLIDVGLAPENPLDTGAGVAGRQNVFSQISQIMAGDDGVDLICMQGQLPLSETETPDPETFAAVARLGKPVIAHGRMAQNVTEAGRAFQEAAGVPFVLGLPETVHALKALGDYGQVRRRGLRPLGAVDANATRLDSGALQDLLGARQIPPPKSAFAETPDEAAVRAREIGFPIALKIHSTQPLHKTELGGVKLHLLDENAVRQEAASMGERLEAEMEGFLVQEQVEGLELLVGLRRDAQYGPFVVVGLGGVQVEAIRDVAFRLLPIDAEDGMDMLSGLRASRLFGEFRGRPPRDMKAAVNAILAFSEIYLAYRDVLEDMEINPLIVLGEGEGVRAVDLRTVWR